MISPITPLTAPNQLGILHVTTPSELRHPHPAPGIASVTSTLTAHTCVSERKSKITQRRRNIIFFIGENKNIQRLIYNSSKIEKKRIGCKKNKRRKQRIDNNTFCFFDSFFISIRSNIVISCKSQEKYGNRCCEEESKICKRFKNINSVIYFSIKCKPFPCFNNPYKYECKYGIENFCFCFFDSLLSSARSHQLYSGNSNHKNRCEKYHHFQKQYNLIIERITKDKEIKQEVSCCFR